MADIFIGYAKQDKNRAEQLAQVLEARGWSVWWDVHIPAGKTFDEVIADALAQARCIVVLWSVASVKSDWVKTEAEEGRLRRILVPVLLDDVTPPPPFKFIQAALLIGWKGTQPHQGLNQLLEAISTIVGPPPVPPEPQRPEQTRGELERQKTLDLPSLIWQFAGDHLGFAVTVSVVLVAVALAQILRSEPEKDIPMSPRITGRDGAPMVLVPAGEFTMGSDDGDEDERPVHKVYLDAFYIDQYEVTTSRYADFMERSRPLVPAGWNEVSLVRDRERPVHGVDWFKADVYCRFYGKRLPTEAEWEKAARGTDGRKYPWGNEDPTSRHANFNRTGWKGYTTLTAVTEHEVGKSPYGVYDMAGNVEEWVSDWYSKTYYQKSEGRNPTGPNTSTGPATSSSDKILRGGDWASNAYYLRSADRQSSDPTDRDNNNRNITNGFRCAKTP